MVEPAKPRFSVVIPTKERANTLKYTLETCLTQGFDSFEIIVCDNCSTEATRQVVESFASPRISYVRSDRPLAMSDNWELALSHARGEYTMIIGDDDGLLPDALLIMDQVIKQTGTPLLRWERVYYSWPDLPIASEANILHIPLTAKNEQVNAHALLSKIATFRAAYTSLPMLYNSAVHVGLINELKAKIGRVFAGRSPDIFSGVAFAYLAASYFSIGRPLAINAGSGKSNGIANMNFQTLSPVSQDFHTLNHQAGLGPHPYVPDLRCLPAEIATNFQWAKELLFPDDAAIRLDRKQLIIKSLDELRTRSNDLVAWKEHLEKIRVALDDDPALLAWFEANYANSQPDQQPDAGRWSPPLGFDGSTLHINTAELGVTDVIGVAKLSETLLGKMSQPLSFDNGPTPHLIKRLKMAARILINGV